VPYFTVEKGRIHTVKLEYNVVSHCNFSCSDCSQFSPYSPVEYSSLTSFIADLIALEKVYHVRRFRFVGGEPTLQKDLCEYVRAVRESGIADQIELVTNGSLLHRVDDQVFRSIDMLSISIYPDPRCDEQKIALAKEKCAAYNVKLKLVETRTFRAMNIDQPIDDVELVNGIFRACQMAHTWHCQTFKDGRFYLCSRPISAGVYLAKTGNQPPDFRILDGVALHEAGLLGRLRAYLSADNPLASCRYCLGSVGKQLPWRPLSVHERKQPIPLTRKAEEMIDSRRMHYLLGCAAVERWVLRVFPSLKAFRALTLLKNIMTESKFLFRR
jgi:GTP 3',8-cyclase